MRRLFRRFGVIWFWAALACEHRALEVWRELRAEKRKRKREAAPVPKVKTADDPDVPAWSLPDSPRMKGLGLGRVWAVMCPFCAEFHTHVPGEGRRSAYCGSEADPRTYRLHHAGELPRELREQFCSSVRQDLPRFLLEGPHGIGPELEAA
jgi:hypothetical protein